MLDLATPHPHPTSGSRYGYPWEVFGSQPWQGWSGSTWTGSTYWADYATMWRTQPSLRKVVDFLARNIAQVPALLYRRVSDTDRVRITDHPLARTLAKPHPDQTRFRFIEALVTELCIFDRGWALELPHDGQELWLRQVPASWSGWTTDPDGSLVFVVRTWAGELRAQPADVFELAGYNPSPPTRCPPCETLRQVLAEDLAGVEYRADMWRNGARLSGWIGRPQEAPEWSDTARERFRREWHGRWTGGSEEAGGTPVLEEGMQFHDAAATAEQSQYVEARKLTLAEVASAYQVPPPMVGLLDQTTFANTKEFRKALYQDTLGPWFELLSEEVERQIMPRWPDLADCYVEFNVQAKLAGAFEDQAEVLSRSVGAPWLTRNEARARANLPHLDGADELIVPLNVIEGGQPSPATPIGGGTAAGAPRVKARTRAEREDTLAARLRRLFSAQEGVVMTGLRRGAALVGLWDSKLWDSQVAGLLEQPGMAFAIQGSRSILTPAEARGFSSRPMAGWISSWAGRTASSINVVTYDALAHASLGADWETKVGGVFEVARSARAEAEAVSWATTTTNFGSREAAKALGRTTKTWRTTSKDPRGSHAALDGHTVGIHATFPNGGHFPGDPNLPTAERARCRCVMEYGTG